MTLYPAFRCTLTVRIFLAMCWLVPCISPLPKSEASCAPALQSVVLENGARYLLWNAPFYSVLGVLLATRYALQEYPCS